MADSRRLLLSLIDRLLDNLRSAAAAAYTKSLGALVAEICDLDAGDAQSAAVYLKVRGFLGHADRLTQDVDRLRQKAEAFRGPFVAEPTAEDRKQEGYLFRSLRSDVHRLLRFLNELKFLVDQDGDAITTAAETSRNPPQADSANSQPAKRTTRRRGARPIYDAAKDTKWETDWKAAHRQGSTKKEFCKAHGIKLGDLNAAMTRNREKRCRKSNGNVRRQTAKRRKSRVK
jgi:hypothetical protein